MVHTFPLGVSVSERTEESYQSEESEDNLKWIIQELDKCDDSIDLIALPEYSNAPSSYTKEEFSFGCLSGV